MVPLSILDLAPICLGSDATTALRNTLDFGIVQHAEGTGLPQAFLGWLRTSQHARHRQRGDVGRHRARGGRDQKSDPRGRGRVMLPNHSPLVIAEQFGTLDSRCSRAGSTSAWAARPARIGLTARAPRRDFETGADTPPRTSSSRRILQARGAGPGAIRAVPGAGLEVPIWLLGSSLYSAQLAALLGLPFAFALAFRARPAAAGRSRSTARGSSLRRRLERPYVMLGLNVFACGNGCGGSPPLHVRAAGVRDPAPREPGPLPPPADIDGGVRWSPARRRRPSTPCGTRSSGSAETVRKGIAEFVEREQPDEIMATAMIFDHAARLRSFEMLAEIAGRLISR